MFLGKYEHILDNKGRLTIPSKYRSGFVQGAILTKGPGDFLLLFPVEKWEELSSVIGKRPLLTDESVSELRRNLYAEAEGVELDSQGRFVLPLSLREHAQINTGVLVAGGGTHVELWSPDFWADRANHRMRHSEMTRSFQELLL